MKRLCFILFALLAAVLFSCAALAEGNAAFSPGETHPSTPAFRLYFKTLTAAEGPVTLAIAERVFDEETAEAVRSCLRSDLEDIAAATGLSLDSLQPCTVFIVERLVNGGVECQGDRVYCQAKDILSGAYRPLLICAALGTEESWVGLGLAGCIWGSTADVSEQELAAYFSTGDMTLLSLAEPFFMPDFATPEEIALVRAASVSLCRYTLAHHGCTALLAGDGIALRQEWLRFIGVERPYDDPLYDILHQYTFRISASYSLVAEDARGNTVYIRPMQDMATTRDLCVFLCDLQAAPEAFFSLVEAESPRFAALLRDRWSNLRIYCGESSSWAVPEYQEIHLALGGGFMHELGHILVPPVNGANYYSTMWQYEGLCYWLSYEATQMDALQRQYLEALQFFSTMETPQTANHRFSREAVRLYLQGRLLPDAINGVDVARYCHAMALVPLRCPELAPDSAWAARICDSYTSLRPENGNELTEYQSFSFTAWLIDQYGLETFLSFCMDGSPFEKAFSIPYETAREGWIDALNAMFPPES